MLLSNLILILGSLFQRTCHVSIIDTGARVAADLAESCSSSFEGEADGVVNELYLRHTWAASNSSFEALSQPQILHRLLHAAHASTLQDGVIMGPSYWDTDKAQMLMAESRVHCAGGGGPCPALASDWVLGAAAWNELVRLLIQSQISFEHFCLTTNCRMTMQMFRQLSRLGRGKLGSVSSRTGSNLLLVRTMLLRTPP